jgi:hypothetical protein
MPMEQHCERCGKKHLREAVWLELDAGTGQYHRPGVVPPERSQGGFPFGADCAKQALAASARRGEDGTHG